MKLSEWLDALQRSESESGPPWRPHLIELDRHEFAEFERICAASQLIVHDKIESQIAELATVRFPDTADADRRAPFALEYIGAPALRHTVGVWAHYPWSRTIAHILPRDDFFDVITDRNHDKITVEEQRILRTKRIGVIGLSVGGEAAVTVAQEHLCGEMVLADYDTLDLSNLNRLGASVTDLGVNKSIIVARRIACIDPYIDVTIFPDGVTMETMPHFLDGLHLLLEECDNLPVKYAVRQAARERGLNIVYAADERGFLSVEPYGLAPDTPLFHGRVTQAPQPRDSFATPLAFMRALTDWLGGWDAISERSRQSLLEIGRTRSGYPQLASEARLAAGQLGNVARRLLLGETLSASVRQVDLEELYPSSNC